MRYLPYQKYNSDFISKQIKVKAYFNPDNSVVVFEEADEPVREWVWRNAAKLKENNFYLTANSVKKIIADIEEKDGKAKEVQAKVAKANKPKPKAEAVDLTDVYSRLEQLESSEGVAPQGFEVPFDKQKLVDEIEEASSIKQLKSVLIEVIKNL